MQFQALIIFLIPSVSALNRALDTSLHEEQAASIGHLTKLGELLSTYPNIKVKLQWLPKKVPFIRFWRARQLAFEAICTADTIYLHKPKSIKKQKDTTKCTAIPIWEGCYYNNPCSSMACKMALQNPLDGKAHHTFNISPTPPSPKRHGGPEPNKHVGDQVTNAKFSRLTHSTLLCFITEHAFIREEYTRQFYPPHTQEQITCPCGEPLQTIEHVLIESQ
jgi:hypothetical protein